MNNLLALQHKFQQHLLHADNDIRNDIVDTAPISSEVRLSIYHHAYRSRLLDALAANYPMLQRYLGYEQFKSLANAYMDTFPSTYRSIRWFGDKLSNFLNKYDPYNSFPCLAELADVEWTMTLTFDAADSPVATIETLATIAPESWAEMRFVLHPSIQMKLFFWNVIPIWQALSQDKTPPELIQHDAPMAWVFWRHQLDNLYCSLNQPEFFVLESMIKNHTFAQICEGLCQFINEQDVAISVATMLKEWIIAGFVSDIKC